METDVFEAVKPLAGLALRFAMQEDWNRAARAVQGIGDQYEGEGVLNAILAWSDTAIFHSGYDTTKPVRLVWMEKDSGRIDTDPDQVRPEVRWAGQVMAARAAMDKPMFNALMTALPDDPAAIGRHVFELLTMAAMTIKVARARKDGDR